MPATRRYLFDTSFDAPDDAAPARSPAEPRFTLAEIEAARAGGVAAGREAALAEVAQQTEQRIAAAIEALSGEAAQLLAFSQDVAAATERQAVALLRAALHKLAPALCRKDPLAEIEALLAQCLSEALDEPRLVLRVAESVFDLAQPRLAAIAAANGYAGRLVLLADAQLAEPDCRVEWADGGAERDSQRLVAAIDELIATSLAPSTAAPLPEKETDHE